MYFIKNSKSKTYIIISFKKGVYFICINNEGEIPKTVPHNVTVKHLWMTKLRIYERFLLLSMYH